MDFKTTTGYVKELDANTGRISCVFSTFNVRDSDGDVTTPGAIQNGSECAISPYGHKIWDGQPPVGRGTIRTTSTEAVFEGQFFMDIPTARDTFLAVKNMAHLQEWSYGFVTVDSEYGTHEGEPVKFLKNLRVFEVSPVLRAAGMNTRTTAAKGDPAMRAIRDRLEMITIGDALALRMESDVLRARLNRDPVAAEIMRMRGVA